MIAGNVDVRPARAADAPGIARVHIESSEDSYAPLAKAWVRPDLDERARKWNEWLRGAKSTDLVAVADRAVVGFIGAGSARRTDVPADVEVHVIHVLPAHRGRGVGSSLWSAIATKIRGDDARSMFVETFAELPCCAFYEARGGLLLSIDPDTYYGGSVHRAVYIWPEGRPHDPRPYRLRPARPGDGEFLFALKRAAYQDHVAATWGAWDDASQRERFFSKFDPTDVRIVVTRGADVGALRVDWAASTPYVGSIELLPDVRGRGLGTAVMGDVIACADVRGVALELQVFHSNPGALRLYERLGFTRIGQNETHVRMKYTPE